MVKLGLLLGLLASLALLATLTAAPAFAGGVVTNCSNDTDFSNKLAGGGTITFNCGAATINLTGTKIIGGNVVIDGGNQITLSGSSGYRHFVVNAGASLDLKNIVLTQGYFNGEGGAVYNSGFLALDHATIQNSVGSLHGGAIATVGAVDITDSVLAGNKASSGGALYANTANARVSIHNSSLHDNEARSNSNTEGRGGALYVVGGAVVDVTSSEIHDNFGIRGGGVYVTATGSTVNFSNARVYKNTGQYSGGGMENWRIATLRNTVFSENTARIGGGIMNQTGQLDAADSTFYANQELAPGYGGGAINNYSGQMTLTRVTFQGNTAVGGGGGIENAFGATANLTNVTFSGNAAGNTGGVTGGLHNYQATASLVNVTFAKNTSPSGAGSALYNENHPDNHLYLKNVLIADSAPAGNCNFKKAPDLSDSNLSTDATCNFGAGRDSVKLKIGPLENNGGATETHRLLPGSRAINRGTNAGCPPTDQRGITRVQDGTCDVGAFEFVPCAGAPPKPVLLTPAKNSQITTPQVLLDWSGPDCAKTYSVVVRQGSKTGPIVYTKSKLKASEATTPALHAHKKYFWQVTVSGAHGSAVSAWFKFKLN